MALVRTEEQEILAHTARELVSGRSPLRRVRELREDETGFSRELWKSMAELGWLGIVVPEQYGGAGLGRSELAGGLELGGRRSGCRKGAARRRAHAGAARRQRAPRDDGDPARGQRRAEAGASAGAR